MPGVPRAGHEVSDDGPIQIATMIPIRNIAETTTPDGARFSLHEHDGEYSLKLNGSQLMSSGWTVSEAMLADAACRFGSQTNRPRILVGGLGLGFSLKRVLELAGRRAEVSVAELLPEVIDWNREFLRGLNGALLDDPRVAVFPGDVYDCIEQNGPAHYDAILLDVDNGPAALVQNGNARLYDRLGLKLIHGSLKPGGRVAFWSADPEPAFLRQLRKVGFEVEEIAAKTHRQAKRAANRIYVGERRAT